MTKKLSILLLLLMGCVLHASAVLKEADLESTLSVLRQELTSYYQHQQKQSEGNKHMREQVIADLMTIMKKSNQNALMLYSQKKDYVFDLTYACHEATEMYKNFQSNILPFKSVIEELDVEIARYDSLVVSLNKMTRNRLSEEGVNDRNVCLTLAVNILRTLKENRQSMSDYVKIYHDTEERLSGLNEYANKRYNEIQSNIFINGGENYFNILRRFQSHFSQTKSTISEKYMPGDGDIQSQWDSRMILYLFATIMGYGLLAIILNFIVIRVLLPKRLRTESFMAKRTCIIMATTSLTFALALGVGRMLMSQNFLIMASSLLIQYAWLLSVVLISLLLRVDGTQIKSTFHAYTPLLTVGFMVIAFRIVLIPNNLVNLIFPPILLVCALWQWWVIRRCRHNIPKGDMVYTYISLCVFVISVVSSWIGYTLLSVQLLIWWIMQLTCILTITCIQGWVKSYGVRHHFEEKPITQSWFYNLLYRVLVPTLGIISVVIAIYWAADVFNLSDQTWRIFTYKFIDTKNFSVSILNIALIVVLWLIFSYLNTTVKAFLRYYFVQKDPATADSRTVMSKNVIQVGIWGIWLLICLGLCKVSFTWLVVVSGGLSTGLGFASKDILENIYYGISLMAGRIKIGDWIICDGIRGRVISISYVSTMLEAIDGSVIAFQNSQLFTKNYKNLTRNHGYELDILEVGVAYGTDIAKCKKLLIEAISKLKCVNKKRAPRIVLREFGDSSINLKILVWVPVQTQYTNDGEILEVVYDTLNKNNISIPFPQRDLHIIHADELTVKQMEQMAD